MITEMVSGGMPSRELNACAATKRKKIIGSQRINAATVRALALPGAALGGRTGVLEEAAKLPRPAGGGKGEKGGAKQQQRAEGPDAAEILVGEIPARLDGLRALQQPPPSAAPSTR